MGSNVNEAAFRAEFSQLLLRGFFSHKQPCVPHGRRHKTRLLSNVRGPRIRNAENQRVSGAHSLLLFLADGKDAAAGRIGNGKIIDQVTLSVRERMKGQIMQKSMRNNDQVLDLQLVPDWRDQQGIKLFQMGLGSFQE